MLSFLWTLAAIGSILGGLIVAVSVVGVSGAPQQAAAALVGVAFAIIPYCLARAVSEMRK